MYVSKVNPPDYKTQSRWVDLVDKSKSENPLSHECFVPTLLL